MRLTDSHVSGEQRRPVARATFFTETTAGLFGTFRFFNTPEGRSAFENTKEGTYSGVSIGFFADQSRTITGSIREVIHADLAHVSLVDVPAYDGAVIIGLSENGNNVPLTPTPRMVLPVRRTASAAAPGSRRQRDAKLRAFLDARRTPWAKTGTYAEDAEERFREWWEARKQRELDEAIEAIRARAAEGPWPYRPRR
ncbi:HK97 family phage prohead protease [Isoptericola dokdonensis]|uniref:Caudovirus prohead protease n=1 Tax=Isoptericola dokdonensis DS-3 TaxID=1300344 RepID=A0A161IIL9_9MICO|nr:HK97 family phage prohead protease [Isoptericola dokdonensis]ANC29930.1 Caudovirus prohead protease [Isoptericola dokdonensis DS-3]